MDAMLQYYLPIIILSILILSLALYLIRIKYLNKSPTKNDIENISEDISSSFLLFSEETINDLFNYLAPDRKIAIRDTVKYLNEGGISSSFLPSNFKSSFERVVENQYILPTKQFKYEYCIRKLIYENKLTVFENESINHNQLKEFNDLIEKLRKYDYIKLNEQQLKDQRSSFTSKNKNEEILLEKLKEQSILHCLIKGQKFEIHKAETGDIVLKLKNNLLPIIVRIEAESLTKRGKYQLQASAGRIESFTIFGDMKKSESHNDSDFILLYPSVIF